VSLISPGFLRLAKQIVRSAAEVGLDEAGTRLCGSAWPAIKNILAPVVGELDRRFPTLMLADDKPSDAEAAAKAADALESDQALQGMLAENFERLGQQNAAILALLARNDEQLTAIGAAIDRGAAQSDRQSEAILQELHRLSQQVATLQVSAPTAAPQLDLQDVFRDLYERNLAAMSQLNAGDIGAAAEELSAGRKLGEAYLQQSPGDPNVAVALGYIEKTQAELDQASRPDQAVAALSRAAALFAQALCSPSRDIGFSALNGMANVYALSGDYDRAIDLGATVCATDPSYGPGLYDYALALDAKWRRDGDDPALLQRLAGVYRQLQPVMANPAQRFAASQLMAVMERARAVEAALASGKPTS
jgi:hypothetical protein